MKARGAFWKSKSLIKEEGAAEVIKYGRVSKLKYSDFACAWLVTRTNPQVLSRIL